MRLRADEVAAHGATAAQPTGTPPSYAITPGGGSSRHSRATCSPRAGPRGSSADFDGRRRP
ncbi:hypothetical protein K701_17075 [Streptomyces fradiae ATCC 10745 = DSM 40063]|uniref:Uncharacterized protein n=1 Tax=Streptomyces fradiae ATCC 10745 = DSM 40063 TaxID=1319510 RepID=A0ABQ6XSG7_STRFR|nr:hypothetical protein K701_17075 [Streptomyces fradiae ATCC 10745 = DSM 40063]